MHFPMLFMKWTPDSELALIMLTYFFARYKSCSFFLFSSHDNLVNDLIKRGRDDGPSNGGPERRHGVNTSG